MSHPEGEGAKDGAEGTQSGAGESTGNGSQDSNTDAGTQSGTETSTKNPELAKLQADVDAHRERMRAADQRASKAEAELKELRDKDLPAQEKLKRDFEESQKQVESLQTANNTLALQVAFLRDNTYTWHNPERALRLVDLSQVEVQSDGSVSGLKDALKALATSDPYLVKKEAEPKEQKPGGTAPGNNGGSSGGKPNTKALPTRFPSMGTRVKRS